MKHLSRLLPALTFLLLAAISSSFTAHAQKLPLDQYMAKGGFTCDGDGWTKGDSHIIFDGDAIKSFTAKQTHPWILVFGDGNKLGFTLNIKPGDVISYTRGVLLLPDSTTYTLSDASTVKLLRNISRSAIFNAERNTMSATDIKVYPEPSSQRGSLQLGPAAEPLEIDAQGNVAVKVAADKRAKQDWLDAYNNRKDQSIEENYEAMCRQYGTERINGTLKGEMHTGIPFEFFRKVTNLRSEYVLKTTYESGDIIVYEVKPLFYEPRKWHEHYILTVNNKTGIIEKIRVKNHFY